MVFRGSKVQLSAFLSIFRLLSQSAQRKKCTCPHFCGGPNPYSSVVASWVVIIILILYQKSTDDALHNETRQWIKGPSVWEQLPKRQRLWPHCHWTMSSSIVVKARGGSITVAAFRRAKRDWEINGTGTPVRMAINDMKSVCQQTRDNGYTEKCKRKKIRKNSEQEAARVKIIIFDKGKMGKG